jgi:hypothetical protein
MSFAGVLILVGLALWVTAMSEDARVIVGVAMMLCGVLGKCAA